MRVAMVTPMAPESAIADVMCQAVPDLALHWDLDVWCPSEPELRSASVPLSAYLLPDGAVVQALSDYDLVIYVLGDSPRHSRILPLAREVPGLVVLHDASLMNLVRHTALETGTFPELLEHVAATTDAQTADLLEHPELLRDRAAFLDLCARLPLDDWAVERALGVVVHSRWHGQRVDGMLLGDVTVAPLPVPSARLGLESNEGPDPDRLLLGLPADAMLLVTVGHVNANRRVDVLLQAIAQDPALSERVHLWAVGAADADEASKLVRLAGDLGLGGRFAITGRVSDAALTDILNRADIGAALRQPVLEGQSASALSQMLSGTPVIVYDHAHYAELPDEVALKVAPDGGPDAVAAALRRLVDDEAYRTRLGHHARDYVLQSRSGSAYAAAILNAGELAMGRKVHAHLRIELAERLQRLGLHKEPAILDVAMDHAFDLFDLA